MELNVTALLAAHRGGQQGALNEAFQLVYDDLRRLAHARLRGQHGNTLNTTALVHELYLKFSAGNDFDVQDSGHLFALSSRAMRQIIVDYARAKVSQKRGGDAMQVTFQEDRLPAAGDADWILAVDQAMDGIREIDERLEQVFECRFFGGLTEEECAAALDVSVSTVQRDWRRAKAWLRDTLGPV